MALSVRDTLKATGTAPKGTVSMWTDLIRRIPVYASNPIISARKQLDFVIGHSAIQGLKGTTGVAPAAGLWVDSENLVKDAASYQAVLKFARENGVKALYLPLQPFKVVLSAAEIKDRLQSACDAPNFLAIELVYSDDSVFTPPTDPKTTTQGAVDWVTGTLDKVCKQGHANPVAVQADVEPQSLTAAQLSDGKAVNAWLAFLAAVGPKVHGYNIDFTVATALIHTLWSGTVAGKPVPKVSKWILDNSDRVVFMDYFATVAAVKTNANQWFNDTVKAGQVDIGIWAVTAKDPMKDEPNVNFLTKAAVADWLVDIAKSNAAVATFGGVSVYRFEGMSKLG